MIKKLIYQSRTTEVSAARSRMIGMYQHAGLTSDKHLSTIFGSLETLSNSLIAAIRRVKTESELTELDKIRDGHIRSRHYLVLGLVHHPDPPINGAASIVYEVLNHYGLSAITTESYASESALIHSLQGDLAQARIQEAGAKLSGFEQCVAQLAGSQANFEAGRIAYDAEKAREATEANATTLKFQAIELVNQKLVSYLRTMQEVDKATYSNFISSIAEIIEPTNKAVKRRRKRGGTRSLKLAVVHG
ncbi:DUF6261 family protein [Sunxiuqinia sp. sy24]|uniref:DUF6261 family protein n=1 Tax=Sunxiuqinia sp. sy24 TaxID=3461495 RepID=UPI00404652C6